MRKSAGCQHIEHFPALPAQQTLLGGGWHSELWDFSLLFSLEVTRQGAPGIRGSGPTQPFLSKAGSCSCVLKVSAVRKNAHETQVTLQQIWHLLQCGVTRSLAARSTASLNARWIYRIVTNSSDLEAVFQETWDARIPRHLRHWAWSFAPAAGSSCGRRRPIVGWCPVARRLMTWLRSNTLERITTTSSSFERLLAFRNTLLSSLELTYVGFTF